MDRSGWGRFKIGALRSGLMAGIAVLFIGILGLASDWRYAGDLCGIGLTLILVVVVAVSSTELSGRKRVRRRSARATTQDPLAEPSTKFRTGN
ncbi:MAG TPA: hypothetical protein PKA20_05795 [Burkholderiaceae bacterium]|nr:hypothetical protein [Burkholderiaceae bacterium]